MRRGRHRPGPSAGSPPSRALLAPGTGGRALPPSAALRRERTGVRGRRLVARRGGGFHLHQTCPTPVSFAGGSRRCDCSSMNGKMEMDVEGVSPREDPIPRSQGAGGACQAPPQPPQPQPQPPPPPQQPAPDEPPGESAGTEDSDDPDPEARPDSEKGESKNGKRCLTQL